MATSNHTHQGTDWESRQFVPEDYFRELACDAVFPDTGRPLEVDLGCGDGGFLLAMAAQFPERDFLGVERFLGRVRKVCRKAARQGLENLRILRLESVYTLEWLLPADAVSRVHLLFPDPWPKKKHHERRLVTQGFCEALRRVLVPDGEFLFKTDHAEYFEDALERIRETGILEEREWPDDAFFYPPTDFEAQWTAAGRMIRRARFVVR